MSTGPHPFDEHPHQSSSSESSQRAEELDDLLARPATLRRYLMRGIGILILAAGLMLLLFVPALNSVRQAETRARATRTAGAVTSVLTVTSNLTFGSLRLDGTPVPGRMPQRVVLHEGRHTIALVAPPFQVATCNVLISPALGGANLRVETPPGTTPPCSQVDANTLIIPVTGANLPADVQDSARMLIRQTLAQLSARTIVIPRGHAYAMRLDARGQPLSQRAASPLTATVSLAPRDPGSDSAMYAELAPLACASALCASTWALNYAHELTQVAWYIEVPVVEQWRFTSEAGKQVGAFQVAANTIVAGGLTYDPSLGWRLGAATPNTPLAKPFVPDEMVDPCGTGMSLLTWMLRGNAAASVVGGRAGSDLLQGCTLTVMSQGADFAQFVWRFGALLAADARAHVLLPNLPIALPAEVKAAGG